MSPLAAPSAPTRPWFPDPTTTDPALTAQHVALVQDVRHRSEPVLALVAARCWPEAELRALTRYLRTVALPQVAGEGAGHGPTAPATARDPRRAIFVSLARLVERLDRAKAATCPLRDLAALVELTLDLLGPPLVPGQPTLHHHDS